MGKASVSRRGAPPRAMVAMLLAIAILSGCGGSSGTGGAAGRGGVGGTGTGGAAGTGSGAKGGASGGGGGVAGTAGSGGAAGTGGAGGSGGIAGAGGSGGIAGAGGSGATGGGAGRGGSSAGAAGGAGGRGGSAGAGAAGRGGGAGGGSSGGAAAGAGGSPDGGATDGPPDVPPCVPTCAGKSCGGDGCGGVCATCPSGQHCTAAFTCAMDVVSACGPGMGLDSAAPWPTGGRCYARRAAASVPAAQKPVITWTYTGGSPSSPVVVGRDGSLYFGKYVGTTYSFQALHRDGTPAWSVANVAVQMSPTIGADGAIYFTSNYSDYGQVWAVDPSGAVRWKATIGHTNAALIVGADGTVYATDDDRTLTALNGTDGSVRFTRANISGGDWSTPAVASDGTLVLARGDVTAMTASGTQLWQTSAQGQASGSVAIGPEGTLYVPFFGDPVAGFPGGVRALDPATGATRWTVNFADDGEWLPAVAGDGTIYQPGQLSLYAIDKSGNLLWVFPVGDYIGGVALGADGTIYLTAADQNLYALNRDGSVAWVLPVGAGGQAPAIGADGTLYVAGGAGLLAIGCAGGACGACVPSCAGRRCGPDGCGSLCGACGAGERCELATRTCQSIAPPGGAGACGDNRGLQAGAPWPALGACPTRIGRSTQLGPRATPSIHWSFTAGDSIYTPPSVAADGTVYFGARDRKLYAIRPDGTLRWTFAAVNSVGSPPTIAADGTIYTSDGATNSNGYVYAIRPDGSKRWSLRFPFGTPSAPMMGGDGTIYAETYGYLYASRMVAIDPLTGTMRWATYAGGVLQDGPALGFDGSVYAHGATLFALTAADGRVLWQQSTTALGLPTAVPVVDSNGNVYAAQDRTLFAFAPDGTTRWTYQPPLSSPGTGLGGAPAIGADGSVLQPVAIDDGLTISALDPATGAIRWQSSDGSHLSMSPIVDGGGWIYYAAYDFLSNAAIIYALDGSGKSQWMLPLPAKVTKPLAIGTNGVLYVSGDNSKLYAVGP